MNMFHDLLQTQNMTLLTSAVGSNGNSDAKMLISRLVVSKNTIYKTIQLI